MTADEALQFLRERQPMPPDLEIDQYVIDKFDEARRLLIANPDPRCVPLFLNAYGHGDGLGVYPLVEDLIRSFSTDVVVPELERALQSPISSVRYWCTQVAMDFPDPRLFHQLSSMLRSPTEENDTRAFAALALGFVDTNSAILLFRILIRDEADPDVRAEMQYVLDYR